MYELLRAHRYKLAVVLLMLTPVALLVASPDGGKQGAAASAPRGAVQRAVGLGQLALAGSVQGVVAWWQSLGGEGLEAENAQLRNEVLRLREEKTLLIGVLQENARLRELLEFRKRHSEYVLAPAVLVGRDVSAYFRTLTVRIRSVHPLEPRMPVVTAGGIVGQVHRVMGDQAEVVLLSDPRSHIDVINQRNRAQGVLQGLGNERDYLARVAYLTQKDEVRVGDVMVTSGMGGVFPKELIVGTVSRVENRDRGLFQDVWVEPAVDLSRLEELFVVVAVR